MCPCREGSSESKANGIADDGDGIALDEALLQTSFIYEMDSIMGLEGQEQQASEAASDSQSESSYSATTETGSEAASEGRDSNTVEPKKSERQRREKRSLLGVLLGVGDRNKSKADKA